PGIYPLAEAVGQPLYLQFHAARLGAVGAGLVGQNFHQNAQVSSGIAAVRLLCAGLFKPASLNALRQWQGAGLLPLGVVTAQVLQAGEQASTALLLFLLLLRLLLLLALLFAVLQLA